MRRIIAPAVNFSLDYVLWSNSRSGHFTQLKTYVPLEWEWQVEKPRMFLILFCSNKSSIPLTR